MLFSAVMKRRTIRMKKKKKVQVITLHVLWYSLSAHKNEKYTLGIRSLNIFNTKRLRAFYTITSYIHTIMHIARIRVLRVDLTTNLFYLDIVFHTSAIQVPTLEDTYLPTVPNLRFTYYVLQRDRVCQQITCFRNLVSRKFGIKTKRKTKNKKQKIEENATYLLVYVCARILST